MCCISAHAQLGLIRGKQRKITRKYLLAIFIRLPDRRLYLLGVCSRCHYGMRRRGHRQDDDLAWFLRAT
jgi:hypothetical protein